ncbi:MAG: TIR domain-containing protein [Candidatus Nanopelagicales bacterium]
MATKSFVSFHYDRDHWRVQQVLNMGAVEEQEILSAQSWESVKRKGKAAIESWIDEQMKGKSAVVVLVGKETASREWCTYEIIKAWNEKRPLVGIRIHGLKNETGATDTQGANPFDIKLSDGTSMSNYVPLYAPSGTDSKGIYASIDTNLATWVSTAYKRS